MYRICDREHQTESTLPWILSTYIERDIGQTINIRRLTEFGYEMHLNAASTARKGYVVYAGGLTPELPDASVLRFDEVD